MIRTKIEIPNFNDHKKRLQINHKWYLNKFSIILFDNFDCILLNNQSIVS